MNNLKKKNSYSISFTAGGLLYDETIALKSYLAKNNIMNIGNEIKRNQYLQTNSESARKRIIQEIRKRYQTVGEHSFLFFNQLEYNQQKIFLYFSCLKTYPIIFDFIFEVLVEKWLSLNFKINSNDVLIFLEKKASNHQEIDQWTATTKQKVATVMIRILKEVGILRNSKIVALSASDEFWNYFIKIREAWFLQACLLNKEQRDRVSYA